MATQPHRIAVVLLVVFACSTVASAVPDVEADARKLEGQLMAPCCGANTLAVHDSAAAHEMKREIREALAAGKSRREILDHYVAIHGTTILSMPEDRGFGLAAYLLPGLALTLGALAVWGALRRRVAALPTPAGAASSLDPAYLERIQREVRDY